MKLANNASPLPGQWAYDTREDPRFASEALDDAIQAKAEEYSTDHNAIYDAFGEGLVVSMETCRELAKWVDKPDHASSVEIVRGLCDALWVMHLRFAREDFEEGRL